MPNSNIKWVELPGKWFQKTYFNNIGEIIFSYHYGSKTKPAIKFIELDFPEAKRLCSFKLIEKDLRDISVILKEYGKLFDKNEMLFSGPNKTPQSGIIAKALLTAIIIHYFRCFPGSQGRSAKLKESEISEENKITHQFLKNMRNKYIAHSDISEYESCKVVYLIPPEVKASRGKECIAVTSFELKQAFGEISIIENIQSLITELQQLIQSKMAETFLLVEKKLQTISPEKIYAFLQKYNEKRIIIDEAHINSLLTK